MYKLYKNIMILSSFLVISSFVLPSFCFAQTTVEAPSTFGEAKDFIISLIKPLPEKMKDIWQNQVLPFWQKMGQKASNWWYNTIKPWTQNTLDYIKSFINEKIIERKPFIEQEFEKEKQELKQEIPEVSKGLWQKLKELIR